MTKREFAALLCKAMSLYALIGAVNLLPLLLEPFLTSSSGELSQDNFKLVGWLINSLPIMLSFVVALVLWVAADKLAAHMTRETYGETEGQVKIVADSATQSILFSALGLYSLLLSIPKLSQIAANLYVLKQNEGLFPQNTLVPNIAGTVVQLALGIYLLVGAPGLVKILHSLRNVGTDKAEVSTESS